jgi:ubiquitin C-terminal hydrolase
MLSFAATKTMSLNEMPPYAVFHIKRIVVTHEGKDGSLQMVKDTSIVEYPLETAFPNTSSTHSKYQLVSTINHIGTAFGGHYTSSNYCRNTHAWHDISDNACIQLPM